MTNGDIENDIQGYNGVQRPQTSTKLFQVLIVCNFLLRNNSETMIMQSVLVINNVCCALDVMLSSNIWIRTCAKRREGIYKRRGIGNLATYHLTCIQNAEYLIKWFFYSFKLAPASSSNSSIHYDGRY